MLDPIDFYGQYGWTGPVSCMGKVFSNDQPTIAKDTGVIQLRVVLGGSPTPSGQTTAQISILSTGGLGVTPANILFPNLYLNGPSALVHDQPTVWNAWDYTNTGAGWHLTLSAGDFFDLNGNSIPVNSFRIRIADNEIVPVGTTSPTPSSLVLTYMPLNPAGITVLSAGAGTGMGAYSFVPHFELFVSGSTPASDYSTTVYITVVAGP